MLGIIFVTVLTSGIFTRPTKADFLNTVTNTVSCTLLNIGNCPTPPTDGTTNPNDQTPPDTTPPADQTDPSDTMPPTSSVTATPNPAGGSSPVVTINGTLTDDTDLASYTLSLEGNVFQQASDLSGKSATMTASWNVASPNVVPSGQYTFVLDVTDKAGNTGTSEVTVTIDNTAPTVAIENGGIIKSGSASPNVTATDDSGIGSYFWTASSSNPEKLDFDPTAKEPTFTPDIEGTYVFYLDVTDSLGNVSSQNEYDFGFKRDLEIIPLPATTDPTAGLADQTPSTPAIVAASANPAIKSGRDEITASDNSAVLGNTVTAPGQAPPTKTVATITPTDKGWSIFGVLWYWWAVVIGIFFAGWVLLKRVVRRRIPENS